MSLGWLNLQDYMQANAGVADEQAQLLDEKTYAPAQGKESLSYGEFLARKRQRADSTGAAALMGGDEVDATLARRGKSTYQAPQFADPRIKQQQQAEESDYWAKQAERNKGLAARDASAAQAQQDAFSKARGVYGTRAKADEDALTYFGSKQSTRTQDDATRRYNEGRYGTMTGARQGQPARRRRLTFGGF